MSTITSFNWPNDRAGRLCLIAAIFLCVPLLTSAIVVFLINGHDNNFVFGTQGMLDDDGELFYFLAYPLGELRDQFPTYGLVFLSMVILITAYATWSKRIARPLILIALSIQATLFIALFWTWSITLPVVQGRLDETWGRGLAPVSRELGAAALPLLLFPAFTWLALRFRRS
ncbi:MAG: hypothetical protein ABI432_14695 [Flavobacteriales bacterium]